MSEAFDVVDFHRDAVETASHEDVGAMRELLVRTLESHGVEPRVDDAGNVRATRGAGDAHLVLQTHLDTVPPHVPYERRDTVPGPDAGAVSDAGAATDERPEGDVAAGRGACDAKGPLAGMVAAFLAVAEPAGRLTLAVTPDEETTQLGAAALAEDLSADAYVVGEPTGLDVCVGARGQFEGTVTIRGEAAHAASPGHGANAVRAAAPMLQAMETYDTERGPGAHDLLGPPTLTATMIDGGEATNQVPAACTITFDRRGVPPEESDAFPASLEAHLASWLPEDLTCEVALVRPDTPFPEAFATDPDAAIVDALQDAGAGTVRAFGAATEASQFADDAPTVVFGPGDLADEYGAVAHAEREYVSLSEVERAAAILERTVTAVVG